MTRGEKLLSGLDLKRMRGIEIGPCMSPIVGKDESEVYYVDHEDQAGLKLKYANERHVDVEKIVPVDAVWGEHTLRECFPDGSCFDYVIASHVIEHVPDMLGWLLEIADVLRPGGRLILAIPDKRYTFDYFRQTSRLAEVIDGYLRRNRRPTPAQIFDFNANAVHLDMVDAWEGRIDRATLKPFTTKEWALHQSVASVRDGTYFDSHCWVFTVQSLAEILADLVELDLLPYLCLCLYEPERHTNEIQLILQKFDGNSREQKNQARHSFLCHFEY